MTEPRLPESTRTDHGQPNADPRPPSLESVAAVAEGCGRLARGFARVKAQLLALARDNVEWSSYLLIGRLANDGPLRSSALAELLQADPSTVSRQIAAMVKDGIVERRADPVDGRASLLVLTGRGVQLHAEHLQARSEHYQRMLADWTEEECRTFATLMTRFSDSVDRSGGSWYGGQNPSSAPRPHSGLSV